MKVIYVLLFLSYSFYAQNIKKEILFDVNNDTISKDYFLRKIKRKESVGELVRSSSYRCGRFLTKQILCLGESSEAVPKFSTILCVKPLLTYA